MLAEPNYEFRASGVPPEHAAIRTVSVPITARP